MTYVRPADRLDYDLQFAAVEPFYEDYLRVREQVVADHRVAYDACFVGRIPGIHGEHETSAIYTLQCLHRVREQARELAELTVDHERVGLLLGGMYRAESVVLFTPRHYVGGTGLIRHYENVRIITDVHARPVSILPPRARTHGYPVGGDRVEVYAKGMTRAR